MSEPRCFSRTQKQALYLAANGRCEKCGADLQKGWHADHVVPHSMGGSTTICNGQALCPSCNLSKSNNTMTNRFRDDVFGPAPFPRPLKWQEKAIREFERSDGRFLADATPGAGKTAFTAYLFRHHYGDLWERIIVITNGITRRGGFSARQEKAGGWIGDLAEFGIETMPNWAGYTERPTLKD